MSLRKHVVITGTGRCGTTFLIELLTKLGLDTGFSQEDIISKKNQEANAGLEHDLRSENCPFIVKSPWFCDYVDRIVSRDDISIEHVFIPIRDLNAAAESRRNVVKTNVSKLSFIEKLKHRIEPQKFKGGLWKTTSNKAGKQEEILLKQIYKLMFAISDTSLPVTFMRYPRIVKDCPYLFAKLQPILGDISYEYFSTIFNETVRPKLIHSFNKNDR